MKPFFPISLVVIVSLTSNFPLPAQPPMKKAYTVPKAVNGVVAILEDDPEQLLPRLTNAAGLEPGRGAREDLDVFSGIHALRITSVQKYEPEIPGWAFKIVEKPQAADEFRFLRFAWKKVGGTGIMLQFYDKPTGWSVRYVAGPNTVKWEATKLDEKAPLGWTVVTRDLFNDFQDRMITGVAFTAMDGSHGLFDHVYLGQSLDDLDARTKQVLRPDPVKTKMKMKEFKTYWEDLSAEDVSTAMKAHNVLMRQAEHVVPFIKTTLKPRLTPDGEAVKKEVLRLIKELDDEKFDVREAAAKQLLKIGEDTRVHLQEAVRTDKSAEVVLQCEQLLKRLGDDEPKTSKATIRSVRAIRILERANTPDSVAILKELAAEAHFATVRAFAAEALQRLDQARR